MALTSKSAVTAAKAKDAPHLDASQVRKAAAALLQHLKKPREDKAALLEDEKACIHMTVRTHKLREKASNKVHRIRIPHSLLPPAAGVELCVIAKDPGEEFAAKLEEHPVPGFTRVISVTKLRKEFHEFKDKRELRSSYDAFFADDRVIRMMPQLLGKTFYGRKKQPVPVDISGAGWAKELERARDSTYVHMTYGQTVSVKIGLTAMTADQVAENVMAAVDQVVNTIPKKWKNVHSVYLEAPNTVALPIYKRPLTLEADESADSADEARAGSKRPRMANGAEASRRGRGVASASEDDEDDDEDIAAEDLDFDDVEVPAIEAGKPTKGAKAAAAKPSKAATASKAASASGKAKPAAASHEEEAAEPAARAGTKRARASSTASDAAGAAATGAPTKKAAPAPAKSATEPAPKKSAGGAAAASAAASSKPESKASKASTGPNAKPAAATTTASTAPASKAVKAAPKASEAPSASEKPTKAKSEKAAPAAASVAPKKDAATAKAAAPAAKAVAATKPRAASAGKK